MTKIAILPEATGSGQITYRAIAGGRQSEGKTAGEALDALASSLSDQESATLVIVQNQRPDAFFSARQRARLDELMARWRTTLDNGGVLPRSEQDELDALVEAELRKGVRERGQSQLLTQRTQMSRKSRVKGLRNLKSEI